MFCTLGQWIKICTQSCGLAAEIKLRLVASCCQMCCSAHRAASHQLHNIPIYTSCQTLLQQHMHSQHQILMAHGLTVCDHGTLRDLMHPMGIEVPRPQSFACTQPCFTNPSGSTSFTSNPAWIPAELGRGWYQAEPPACAAHFGCLRECTCTSSGPLHRSPQA